MRWWPFVLRSTYDAQTRCLTETLERLAEQVEAVKQLRARMLPKPHKGTPPPGVMTGPSHLQLMPNLPPFSREADDRETPAERRDRVTKGVRTITSL